MIQRLLVLLLLCSSLGSLAQSTLIKSINESSFPIEYILPEEPFNDLKGLKDIFKDKKIIALGEATHGTHEFYNYKHRLVRYLVQVLGYKNLILETDFAGTQTLNKYLLYGLKDPYTGMQDMNQGVFETQELLDMIEWIKTYNSTKADVDKVKIYGSDMQEPNSSAAGILAYFREQQIVLQPELKTGLVELTKWKYQDMSKEDKNSFLQTLVLLRNLSFKGDTTGFKTKYCKQLIRILEQYWDYHFNVRRHSHLRDRYMAENCKWVINNDSTQKTIVWAHNGHIQKDPSFADVKPMGQFLAETYGRAYYAMGFGYDNGTLRAFDLVSQRYATYEMTTSLNKNSSTYTFKQVESPNFILDFKNPGMSDELRSFLNTKMWFRELGAFYQPENKTGKSYNRITLSKAFDGMIFFRQTTPSQKVLTWKIMHYPDNL